MTIYAILLHADPGNTLGDSCLTDIYNVSNYLFKNFEDIKIHILLNEDYNGFESKFIMPSNKEELSIKVINNIHRQISEIKGQVKDTDTLFFYISGHGMQMRDRSDEFGHFDEDDRLDEYIVTKEGILLDDYMSDLLLGRPVKYYKDLEKRYKFISLIDTCHSGTMLDMTYYININGPENVKTGIRKSEGHTNTYYYKYNDSAMNRMVQNAICLGACSDNQKEVCDIVEDFGFGGALTCHMLKNDYLKDLFSGDVEKILNVHNGMKELLSVYNQVPVLQSMSII